jgi:hypothetical protein
MHDIWLAGPASDSYVRYRHLVYPRHLDYKNVLLSERTPDPQSASCPTPFYKGGA